MCHDLHGCRILAQRGGLRKTLTPVRVPARHNIWDAAILVPVEDVWQVHGLASGHDVGDLQHIGPPWNSKQLPGLPAIAIKPESVAAAYLLRGQFRSARSLALFPAEVLNELYLTLGNVRELMSLLAIATQVLVVPRRHRRSRETKRRGRLATSPSYTRT